jgi:hypothetical protein
VRRHVPLLPRLFTDIDIDIVVDVVVVVVVVARARGANMIS